MTESPGAIPTAIGVTLGGAWGGAIVGLAEATLITVTSAPGEEYWLFPYAVVSYGMFGLLVGLGGAMLFFAVAAASRRRRPDAFGVAAGTALFVAGAAVTRYHVILRVFHEELITVSPVGLAVHAALVAGMAALAVGMVYVSRALVRHQRGLIGAAIGLVSCLGISSGAAVLAAPRSEGLAVNRSTSPAAKGHPNVILIIADTLRADAVGPSGATPSASPALDQFAAEGVRFVNAYSQSTWTRPSIATILTSLYPSVHGLMHKLDPLPDQVTTLAEALKAKGYWTAGFVSNINVAPVFNFQQGFDEYRYLAPDFYFGATDSATRLAIYKGLRVIRERLFRDRIYFNNYYQDAQVVDAAVSRWLDDRPPSPFFLLIHYMDPHDPYFEMPYNGHGVARVNNPDPPASRKDELHHLYMEDVTYLDHYLGALMARLKSLGLYEDSVVVVTADHGEEFQEHGGWWHGTTLYQEQVHVPLIVKRAHEMQPGAVRSDIVRSVDIAPTMMSTAGLSAPREFAGYDLFSQPPGEPEPLFAEEDFEGNVLASLRIGSWKVITANPDNPRGLKPVELYDLSRNPAEQQNLAAAEPAQTTEMLQQLARERAKISGRASLGGVGDPRHAADRRS